MRSTIFVHSFLAIYHAITRWERAKKAFITGTVGFVLIMAVMFIPMQLMKSEVRPIVVGFLKAAASSDIDKAYTYWYSGSEKEEVENIIIGNKYTFEGFEDFKITDVSISYPWTGGAKGNCDGIILYGNGNMKDFGVILIRENEVWKIKDIWIGLNRLR